MSSPKRIDFPPREFSSIEIKALLMLAAEAQENIDHIGETLIAISNTSHLDRDSLRLIRYLDAESKRARVKIDKIMSIVSVEKELITGES